MAKKKTTQPAKQPSPIAAFLKRRPNFAPLLILFLLLVIFYNEVIFGGKTFITPDTLTSSSVQPFVRDALDRGIYPQWNPYIFSGMPSFASLQSAPYIDLLGNVIQGVLWLWDLLFPLPDFLRLLINYFLFGFFMYLLIFKKTASRPIALFAALALVFQPQVVAFAAFGHNTKLTTIALLPAIFFLLDELLQKRQLHHFALLALAVGLQLLRAHTQMAYYTFMMIGLYFLFYLVETIRKKEGAANVGKSLALGVAALAVGAAMSAWLYLPVQEYSHYSIRGGGTGLDYGYATNWSFSPLEVITFFVPSFVGFGGETYWGTMPFTDFPFYMGIVTLLLAGLALVIKRDRYVIFFSILAGLSLLVSFGKNFPLLYDPLFKLLPFFNKFRVPSMILILTAFSAVSLAALGLHALIHSRDQHSKFDIRYSMFIRRYVYIFIAAAGVITLLLIFGKNIYLDWIAGSQKPLSAAAREVAHESAALDAVKMLLLLGAGGFLILQFLKNKIKAATFAVAMIALAVLDLWLIDFKINNPHPQSDRSAYFAETPAVAFLKSQAQQSAEPFRIFPAFDLDPQTQSLKSENWYQYHLIQSIRGYHAAKLKIYQEFIEETGFDVRNRYGFPPLLEKYLQIELHSDRPGIRAVPPEQIPPQRLQADNAVMDLLNVKYLISHYPVPDPRYKVAMEGRPSVLENTGVPGRAFFVDAVKVLAGKEAFFSYLKSGQFDPAKEATLEEPPPFAIEPAPENSVKITSYDIHEIHLQAYAAKPALLVLSEIYYPAGWKAFVDGKETKIYKTNYILRSIFLEPGDHQIKFVYESSAFKIGLALTFGILFLLVGVLIYSWKVRRQTADGRWQT